jgi:hypothetical protein
LSQGKRNANLGTFSILYQSLTVIFAIHPEFLLRVGFFSRIRLQSGGICDIMFPNGLIHKIQLIRGRCLEAYGHSACIFPKRKSGLENCGFLDA